MKTMKIFITHNLEPIDTITDTTRGTTDPDFNP